MKQRSVNFAFVINYHSHVFFVFLPLIILIHSPTLPLLSLECLAFANTKGVFKTFL